MPQDSPTDLQAAIPSCFDGMVADYDGFIICKVDSIMTENDCLIAAIDAWQAIADGMDDAEPYDGDFSSAAYHPECRVAEVAFNDLHGTWGDEWMDLGSDCRERDDNEWIAKHHSIVAERLGIPAYVSHVVRPLL